MDTEQLALLGIVIFGFMALMQGFRTLREAQLARGRKHEPRPRRAIASEPAATEVARALLQDLCRKHPELVSEASATGKIPPRLDREIQTTMRHYLTRTDSRFKGTFHRQVSELILHKTPE